MPKYYDPERKALIETDKPLVSAKDRSAVTDYPVSLIEVSDAEVKAGKYAIDFQTSVKLDQMRAVMAARTTSYTQTSQFFDPSNGTLISIQGPVTVAALDATTENAGDLVPVSRGEADRVGSRPMSSMFSAMPDPTHVNLKTNHLVMVLSGDVPAGLQEIKDRITFDPAAVAAVDEEKAATPTPAPR
ncbi:MAG: hypothetical protein P1U34_10720 [Coxiellaceae bacterium]|nr:hypothetical protein [Coxiellaceae bacterium]